MTKRTRRIHSLDFKAKVALAAINGVKRRAELAKPFDVHPHQITAWKAQLQEGAAGPFGADTMFHKAGYDAFTVILHDQGHIAAKMVAPHAKAGMTIGAPVLFSSVAHGSGHDIAGRCMADPTAMISAVARLCGAPKATPKNP